MSLFIDKTEMVKGINTAIFRVTVRRVGDRRKKMTPSKISVNTT